MNRMLWPTVCRTGRHHLRAALWLLLLSLTTLAARAQQSQVFGFAGANWAGDVNTQGGLDAGLAGDADCLTVSGDAALGYPAITTMTVTLAKDLSRQLEVALWIGYRVNSMQARAGTILWDGQPIATCNAYGTAEELHVKKVVVSTSDYDFSAGTHALTIQAANDATNDWDFLEVDAIKLAPLGTYHGDDPRPAESWLIVTGGETAPAVTDQVGKLAAEMAAAGAGTVAQVAASALTEAQKANNHLILVGQYANNALAQQVLDAQGLGQPFAADADFVKEQGYVAGVYPGAVAGDRKALVAVGWGQLGAVYALSHLRTHLRYAGGRPYLDVEGSPNSFTQQQVIRRPDLAERGIYYNIAYGISYGALTPDNWNESQWQYWVDKQVCAQYTHIYFFLWGNVELYFPKSPLSYTIRNRSVHQNLIKMIDYAHRRGLKVTYQFSPTLIPADIYSSVVAAVPGANGVNSYNDSILCPAETSTLTFGSYSWAGSMELMKDVYGNELEQFKNADEFNLWFYDPGGCFCGTGQHNCKGNQTARLVEQADTFYQLVRQKNPQARFTIVTWPIGVLEGMYGISYRNTLVAALKTHFADKMDHVSVLDAMTTPETVLPQARAQGFRLNGFVYWTNIETGYPFLIPTLDYLKTEAARSKTQQVSALHCMRIEEGGKFPNTFFAAQIFWNRDVAKEQVVRDYAGWIANTDATAADQIYQAIMLLDGFMNLGSASQDMEAKGAQIKALIDGALARLSTTRQTELEWLKTTGAAVALLGQAAEHDDQLAALTTQYTTLIFNSPAFKPCSAYAATAFPQYVTWLRYGWNNYHF